MITLDALKAVRTIVVHDNCADGLSSALIARDACPDAEIVFLQYGTDAFVNLPATPGMLFADISPHPDRVAEFVAAGAIVLDHHRTQRSIVEAFGDNGVFGDETTQPGVCGATLVYEHVYKPVHAARTPQQKDETADFVSQFARLAGVRDTWQRRDPQWHEAGVQQATLMFFPPQFWLEKTLEQIAAAWPQYRWIGDIQVAKHEERVAKASRDSDRFTTARGTRVVCFEGVRFSSDAAERLDKEVDLVIGFSYRVEEGVPKLLLSTRSHTDFDCADFARSYGGGGHTRAAGCCINFDITDAPNPYAMIRNLLTEYEERRASNGGAA